MKRQELEAKIGVIFLTSNQIEKEKLFRRLMETAVTQDLAAIYLEAKEKKS